MAGEHRKEGARKRLPMVVLVAAVVVSAVAVPVLWRYAGVGERPAAGTAFTTQPGVFASEPLHIDAGNSGLVALGRTVYAAHCAACHGAEREGEPDWRTRKKDGTLPAPPHDETGHTWHHSDALLFAITKSGGQAVAPAGFRSGMPGFAGTLTDREIAASIAFVKSQWPRQIRQRQEFISRQAQ